MQATSNVLQPEVVLLIPVFFTIESTRAALWVARAVYGEPDCRDGGLVRVLFALVVGLVPSPVWRVVTYALCVAWVPVRAVLWVWGIGRGSFKKGSPAAVTKWYAYTRARRTEALRRRQL